MKTSIYYRVGILFLVAVIIIFWGINFLKGKDILQFEKTFYAEYNRIGGLTRSSPVTLNGFQVGQVRGIKLSDKKTGMIEVRFSISEKSIDIPKGSIARIYSVDLMGTKGIEMVFSGSAGWCTPGDTLAGAIEGDLRDQVSAQVIPLKIKAEEIMSSLDSVLTGINLIFNEKNRNNLQGSFSSINGTLDNLEKATGYFQEYLMDESSKISHALSNIDSISQDLRSQTSALKNFISNLNQISDSLAGVSLVGTFNSLNGILNDLHLIVRDVNQGQGTLGRLVTSDTLYSALLATNASLNRVIEDIRINPGRYVSLSLREKQHTIYSPGDTELARLLSSQGAGDYYLCIRNYEIPSGPDEASALLPADNKYIQVGNRIYEFIYQSRRIEDCIRRLDRSKKDYPEAGIFTWVNGLWTRLEI
jgi:phospholipid/cholesterol/gamma-HCH transport system substrate-binding protein